MTRVGIGAPRRRDACLAVDRPARAVAAGRRARRRPASSWWPARWSTWPAGPGWRWSAAVEPPRVEKGRPAIAVIQVDQPVAGAPWPPSRSNSVWGTLPIRARLPRLRGGEQGLRTYRLPTGSPGRLRGRSGGDRPGRPVRAVPHGATPGCARSASPCTPGCWPAPAAGRDLPPPRGPVERRFPAGIGHLSPPAGVRLRGRPAPGPLALDRPGGAAGGAPQRRHGPALHRGPGRPPPQPYSAETFEEAVDVTASLVVSLAAGPAPVQLRLTNGDRLGGPSASRPHAPDRLSHRGATRCPDGIARRPAGAAAPGPGRHGPGGGDGPARPRQPPHRGVPARPFRPGDRGVARRPGACGSRSTPVSPSWRLRRRTSWPRPGTPAWPDERGTSRTSWPGPGTPAWPDERGTSRTSDHRRPTRPRRGRRPSRPGDGDVPGRHALAAGVRRLGRGGLVAHRRPCLGRHHLRWRSGLGACPLPSPTPASAAGLAVMLLAMAAGIIRAGSGRA